ncbi:hypothetical protein [Archangium violaceum]|uniref:Uncharacterized protein n=1 Tax=Archangium violaceum Cb vi76 TaxID=1406225 RepID=A0A084T0T9_9BACT|nr:hypothetical protein [Archangium violaceum]KFA94324.1 hypothetical protein Q664_03240 [Archangium violaceum Cb vi76]
MRAWKKLLLLGLALLPARALAQRLCFPEATTPPGSGVSTPTLDGKVQGDVGWSNAFRYVFQGPASGPHAAMQGLRKGSDLYLSFEVEDDSGFDQDDTLVLAFRPVGTDQYRLIDISPVSPGVGSVTDKAPLEVTAWKVTGTPQSVDWSKATPSAHPEWIEARMATSGDGTARKAWTVELRLPDISRTEQGLALGGVEEFDFHAAVLVDGDPAVALVWPPGAPAPEAEERPASTAPPTTWRRAYLKDTGCGGVSLGPDDIRTLEDPGSTIDFQKPNRLVATVHNASVSTAGLAAEAEGVTATFLVSNEGVTAQGYSPWQLLPAPGNPTPRMTIPAEGSQSFSTGEWMATQEQLDAYESHPEQVVLVELDAQPGSGTYLAHRSAWRNMRFGEGGCNKAGGALGAVTLGLFVLGIMRRRRNGEA